MFKHDPLQDGHSRIEWVDHGNNDLTIVNAARTSFAKWHDEFDDTDARLIKYLAQAKPVPHFMPFCHVQLVYLRELPIWQFIQWIEATQKGQFYRRIIGSYPGSILFLERGSLFAYAQQDLKPHSPKPVKHALDALDPAGAFRQLPGVHFDLTPYIHDEHLMLGALADATERIPITPRFLAEFLPAQHRLIMPLVPVRDQWLTHKVDFVRSTASGRYVPYNNGAWNPQQFHLKPEGSIKQGSSDTTHENSHELNAQVFHVHHLANVTYDHLIAQGIAPEEARVALPVSTYTTMIETASLAGYARLCRQRLDSHAQRQIRAYAAALDDILSQKFPHTWPELKK